jgi:hypothetical protein
VSESGDVVRVSIRVVMPYHVFILGHYMPVEIHSQTFSAASLKRRQL